MQFASPFPASVCFVVRREADANGVEFPAAELALVPSTAVEKRRREFRVGRLAARLALEAADAPAGPILSRPDRSPIWPDGFVGSITHGGGFGAAAVASTNVAAGLGVDIENASRVVSPSVTRLVADEHEKAWIDGDNRRLITLFSAKEAVFKAIYPLYGTFFGFEAAHLDAVSGGFVARLTRSLGPLFPAGTELPVTCTYANGLVLTSVMLNPL